MPAPTRSRSHYLKTVAAMGAETARKSGRDTVAKMKALPTDDDAFGQGRIRIDGRGEFPSYLLQVKKPSESTGEWDLIQAYFATTPQDVFFTPCWINASSPPDWHRKQRVTPGIGRFQGWLSSKRLPVGGCATERRMAHKSGDIQFAALPWRINEDGRSQVMLLTTRETRRWTIPKGWPMKGRKPAEVASQEAYEEAGLVGHIVGKRPLGVFHYEKQLAKESRLCQVRVFSFRVERQLDDWPEKQQRETKWFDATEAAALVEEDGLHGIISRFAGSYVRFVVSGKTRHSKKRYRSIHGRPPADQAGRCAASNAQKGPTCFAEVFCHELSGWLCNLNDDWHNRRRDTVDSFGIRKLTSSRAPRP